MCEENEQDVKACSFVFGLCGQCVAVYLDRQSNWMKRTNSN